MRKTSNATFNVVATVLAVLLVIAAIPAVLLMNFKHTLLNAETYKHALTENNVYEQLPALVAQELSTTKILSPCPNNPQSCDIDGSSATGSAVANPFSDASAEVKACAQEALGDETYQALLKNQRAPTQRETRQINTCFRQERKNERVLNPGIGGELLVFVQDFSPEQWQETLLFLFPGDDLQHMTESLLDQAFSYLNGETNSLKLSLVNLKARLTGQASQELSLLLLAAQPPCTKQQVEQINAGNFENGGDAALYCAATGQTLAKMLPGMLSRVHQVYLQMPDEAVIIKPPSEANESSRRMLVAKTLTSTTRTINTWTNLSLILTIILLLLVTAFGVRSIRDWLRWWGIPFLIAGLILVGIGFATQPIFDWAWANYAASGIRAAFTSGLGDLSRSVMRSATQEMAKWVMIEAGVIAFLGLVAILVTVYVMPDVE